MILNKRDEQVRGADCFRPPQPVIKCLAGQACSNNPIKRQPCTNEARGGGDPIRSKTTTSKAIIITFNIINDSIIIITFAIDNGIVSILWPSDHLNLISIIGLMRQRCKIGQKQNYQQLLTNSFIISDDSSPSLSPTIVF